MSTINASTISRDLVCFSVGTLDDFDVGTNTSFEKKSILDTTRVHINKGGWTITSGNIFFPDTGYYVIGGSLYYHTVQADDPNDRICVEMKFFNQTNTTELSGSGSIAAMGYCRNLNSSGFSGPRNSSSMITQIISINSGEKISVYIKRGADFSHGCKIDQQSCIWGFKLQ